MTIHNLNELLIPDADGKSQPLDNFNTQSATTSVYFRDLEKYLINHIKSADIVLGAVAWLTSYSVLDALAQDDKEVVFVIQKEDFLRPDIGAKNDFKETLRKKYSNLKNSLTRYDFEGTILPNMSYAGDPSIDSVTCIGNVNNAKAAAFPRMHNKFIIFSKKDVDYNVPEEPESGSRIKISPYAVWTGSFNITKNAGMSFENALYITDMAIVNAYYQEFAQITALSESLNWFKDWVEPQWRIGT
ncbi:phospholipase D-like domain-containing protein [Rahnella contaminans]|uniref:phospholipase D-like domain-containing protein n=1 Tax=Rahnella contaminans TaxID=2703882 RepID=UPI0023DC08DD|nr:phospholipase D-like domain-containing protein [Rahnella contaminans]MDF1894881.1 phospholipase D-like domain-containing protein [Rahnella contaminans]